LGDKCRLEERKWVLAGQPLVGFGPAPNSGYDHLAPASTFGFRGPQAAPPPQVKVARGPGNLDTAAGVTAR